MTAIPRNEDRALLADIVLSLTSGTNTETQGKAKADAVAQGKFDKDATMQAVARFRIDATRDCRLKLARLADWLSSTLGTAEALSSSNPREIAELCTKVAHDLRIFLASLSPEATTDKDTDHG